MLNLDWSFIRRYTLLPAITLLVSIALLCGGLFLKNHADSLHEQLSANQQAMQHDYEALIRRRQIVERYHRRYSQYAELGFIGLESRLDWIETLRETVAELTLPRISYLIEPQLNAIAPVQSIQASNDVAIHVSRMQLEMNLLHELDLLNFVDELQQKAPGLIKIDRCELIWQADSRRAGRTKSNIGASCSIAFYSVITADVARGATL